MGTHFVLLDCFISIFECSVSVYLSFFAAFSPRVIPAFWFYQTKRGFSSLASTPTCPPPMIISAFFYSSYSKSLLCFFLSLSSLISLLDAILYSSNDLTTEDPLMVSVWPLLIKVKMLPHQHLGHTMFEAVASLFVQPWINSLYDTSLMALKQLYVSIDTCFCPP